MRLRKDLVPTTSHHLYITPIYHSTVLLEWGEFVVYVDPSSQGRVDFSGLSRADLILITHSHPDHFDREAINLLSREDTWLVIPPSMRGEVEGTALGYGESIMVEGVKVKAVPAYNLERDYHPFGWGNGYLLEIGSREIYFAGDTDCIPEMREMFGVYIAFIPMREPYTMSAAEAAECVRLLQPSIVYPYHHGDNDPFTMARLLKDVKDIEVRVRSPSWMW